LIDKMEIAETKIVVARKKNKGKEYETYSIYLPKKLVEDPKFPFNKDDILLVKIERRKLVIERKRRRKVKK